MQPFRFSLAGVLKVRQRQEERSRQEFKDQLRRVKEQESAVDKLLSEQASVEQQARTRAQQEVDIAFETQSADYLQVLKNRLAAARKELLLRREELEKQRKAWMKAQQALKILEKLRERKKAEYQRAAQRQEQNFLDEVAATHHQNQEGRRTHSLSNGTLEEENEWTQPYRPKP